MLIKLDPSPLNDPVNEPVNGEVSELNCSEEETIPTGTPVSPEYGADVAVPASDPVNEGETTEVATKILLGRVAPLAPMS